MRFDLTLIVLALEIILMVSSGFWVPAAPPYARGGGIAMMILFIITLVLYLTGKA